MLLGFAVLSPTYALIPIKSEPETNEEAMAGIRADKTRDGTEGYDGGWVVHSGLVDTAMQEFVKVLVERENQIDKKRDDVDFAHRMLCAVSAHRPLRRFTRAPRQAESVMDRRFPGGQAGTPRPALFSGMPCPKAPV